MNPGGLAKVEHNPRASSVARPPTQVLWFAVATVVIARPGRYRIARVKITSSTNGHQGWRYQHTWLTATVRNPRARASVQEYQKVQSARRRMCQPSRRASSIRLLAGESAAVEALGVDADQDFHAVSGSLGDPGRGSPSSQPQQTAAPCGVSVYSSRMAPARGGADLMRRSQELFSWPRS